MSHDRPTFRRRDPQAADPRRTRLTPTTTEYTGSSYLSSRDGGEPAGRNPAIEGAGPLAGWAQNLIFLRKRSISRSNKTFPFLWKSVRPRRTNTLAYLFLHSLECDSQNLAPRTGKGPPLSLPLPSFQSLDFYLLLSISLSLTEPPLTPPLPPTPRYRAHQRPTRGTNAPQQAQNLRKCSTSSNRKIFPFLWKSVRPGRTETLAYLFLHSSECDSQIWLPEQEKAPLSLLPFFLILPLLISWLRPPPLSITVSHRTPTDPPPPPYRLPYHTWPTSVLLRATNAPQQASNCSPTPDMGFQSPIPGHKPPFIGPPLASHTKHGTNAHLLAPYWPRMPCYQRPTMGL